MPKDSKKSESRQEARASAYPNLRPLREREGRGVIQRRDGWEPIEETLENKTSTQKIDSTTQKEKISGSPGNDESNKLVVEQNLPATKNEDVDMKDVEEPKKDNNLKSQKNGKEGGITKKTEDTKKHEENTEKDNLQEKVKVSEIEDRPEKEKVVEKEEKTEKDKETETDNVIQTEQTSKTLDVPEKEKSDVAKTASKESGISSAGPAKVGPSKIMSRRNTISVEEPTVATPDNKEDNKKDPACDALTAFAEVIAAATAPKSDKSQ